ncbi:hypothetical protein ACAB25_004415 [Salmonella enterica subsp. enterica serovar Newport]|uniref:hypothetical protein n=1 Tax=Salmonella enterica TaxID=28901 RepID=UPI0009B18251|nr:hypothetical protein [Salmonella enterica]ECE7421982.1 hypothetical protein [Salmonella enterica subsp. enterica serovar Newport]EAO0399820.1 hypothetical protein [Salmonella enterica]EAQ0293454.1 hypothetical protein [Salmonella enterica]EHW4285296.1 hypothetical protein [Salmonella enterica subsp. enterica serovar Newport]EJE9919523.1 hypothetical protein [Salmonella enterica]
MFDFPQPGETYRCTGFPDVVVSGVLADGIPWDMPYRCPGLVWNPYRRTYTILIRIIAGGRMAEIPLSRFLRDFTCEHPDIFKRNPENRHAVLREIAADPALQQYRARNIDNYPDDIPPVKRPAPVAHKWRNNFRPETEIKSDNSYRHYL